MTRIVELAARPMNTKTKIFTTPAADVMPRRDRIATDLGRRARIVVVGLDRPEMKGWVTHLLACGYDVTWVGDSDRAQHEISSSRPDLIITELTVAHGDGIALCGWVQRSFELPPPVILVTRSSKSSIRVRGFDAGATDIVHFTCSVPELEARVRSGIRRKLRIDALADQAATDPLTGLWNRRHADARLGELSSAANRRGSVFSCITLDLDDFKAVNDNLGHAAGDAVLLETSRRIQKVIRRSDLAFRFGGEEFLVLAPDTSGVHAIKLADRIRVMIASRPFALPHLPDSAPTTLTVTASVGVATWSSGVSPEELLRRTDAAMYRAKERGKNRVVADLGVIPQIARRPHHVPVSDPGGGRTQQAG